jgi:hypothetical protein
MIDANNEINRLRQSLKFKNLSNEVIDSICDDVAREISDLTSDLLAQAMSEAVQSGKSAEFIQEVRSTRDGGTFSVSTDSGKTNFTEAPFPMLPKMLQNAKIAKDGSLYKVIPVKRKGSMPSRTAVTTEAALGEIERARIASKVDRTNQNRGSSSPDAMRGMDTLSAMQAISKSRQKVEKYPTGTNSQTVDFRTASSKQDPSTQWVHPGREADMTRELQNINANLHDSIDNIILQIISKYEGQF